MSRKPFLKVGILLIRLRYKIGGASASLKCQHLFSATIHIAFLQDLFLFLSTLACTTVAALAVSPQSYTQLGPHLSFATFGRPTCLTIFKRVKIYTRGSPLSKWQVTQLLFCFTLFLPFYLLPGGPVYPGGSFIYDQLRCSA